MAGAAGRRGPRSGRDGRGEAALSGGEGWRWREGRGGVVCRDGRGTLDLFWVSPAHENCKKRKKRSL